jgi:hypothetical protein
MRSMISIGSVALLGALAFAPAAFGQQQGVGGGTGPARVGAEAPEMNLFDLKGQVFVIEFINPTDQKWLDLYKNRRLGQDGKLKETRDRYKEEGIFWLTICPYESTSGTTAPVGGVGANAPVQGIAKMDIEELRTKVEELDLDFPVLYDEGGKIMKSFGVAGIPHVIIVDKQGKIAYSEKLRGETGELVGLDTFDRAVGDAIKAEGSTGTLPAGAPREGQAPATTDRERLERERLERERMEKERLERDRPR